MLVNVSIKDAVPEDKVHIHEDVDTIMLPVFWTTAKNELSMQC